MLTRRRFFTQAAGTAVLVGAGAAACGTDSDASGSSSATATTATAITQVYGDGLKLSAVALQYEQDIDTTALTTSAFSVPGRTITNVYANTSASTAASGTNGKYVIIELDPADEGAALWASQLVSDEAAASGPSGSSDRPTDMPTAMPTDMPTGSSSGAPAGIQATIAEASASVTQTASIATVAGSSIAASDSALSTSAVVNLIVDDFQAATFTDSTNGNTLQYDLFTPADYDASQSYPLVLFMPDATASGTDPRATLCQGLGGVCWASPEDQAKRPAFVLALQFAGQVVGDDFSASTMLDTIVNLVNSLTEQYSIDTSRMYSTGQSGGAMTALAIDVKYPDMFAASWIVAGQWDPATVTPLATKPLWITVSEGDEKAYPYENQITAILQAAGASVSTATWDGSADVATLDADADDLAAAGASINYSIFAAGTVVPDGTDVNATNEHLCTWRVAYTIDTIRDWIFQQSK